jgi:hypothetical protein
MNNFKHLITPEQAKEKGDSRSIGELRNLANPMQAATMQMLGKS